MKRSEPLPVYEHERCSLLVLLVLMVPVIPPQYMERFTATKKKFT